MAGKARKQKVSRLVRRYRRVPDPRSKQGRRHPLAFILALTVTAGVAGARGSNATAEYGRQLPWRALRRLGCRPNRVTGRYRSPSANTIRDTLAQLDPTLLCQVLREAHGGRGRILAVAVDGKTLRGSKRTGQKAVAVISALDVATGLVLAQREISEEHLEIPEFRPLLEYLPLEGVVVTADALHTQVDNAIFLVEEKQADFLFVVKGNQENLFGELNRWPVDRFTATYTSVEKGHDRVETRTLWVGPAAGHFLPFPYVQQVFKIRRCRMMLATGEQTEEISFGVTSLSEDQAGVIRLAELIRGHWGIENSLHWVKDQTLGEDSSRVRKGAAIFALIRSHVLFLLRRTGATNLAAKLRHLGWDWRRAFAAVGT